MKCNCSHSISFHSDGSFPVELDSSGKFAVDMEEDAEVAYDLEFQGNDTTFPVGFEKTGDFDLQSDRVQVIYVGANEYEGEYTVVPKFSETKLQTKDKIMRDNVTVTPIPVRSTINESGGATVYIGMGDLIYG